MVIFNIKSNNVIINDIKYFCKKERRILVVKAVCFRGDFGNARVKK